MKKVVVVAAAMLALGVTAAPAEAQSRPGGCLKYGLGGAVAGHFAGGHRLKGALAGCALGIYQRRQHEREVRERARSRTREAERSRTRTQDRTTWNDERNSGAARNRVPQAERANPYEDLGFDFDAGTASRREQAGRTQRRQPEGFEPGGSFLRRSEPRQTGSISGGRNY